MGVFIGGNAIRGRNNLMARYLESTTGQQPLIMIVEDEQDVVTAMEFKLALDGYRTRSALTGNAALQTIFQEPLPDLVLLDVVLPDISGIEICMRLRKEELTRAIPILLLTAKGAEIDRVVGLEAGADDYLVKPFSIRELMLRIKIALRRTSSVVEERPKRSVFKRLTVEHENHKVFVEGEEVILTATEFKLLTLFLESPDKVQNRDYLLDIVWGLRSYVQTRTVDSHIKHLRKKLRAAGIYIETIRGVGYRFSTKSDQT